jgi:hypothetical protein
MVLFNVKGKLVSKPVGRFRINWDKKSRSQLQFSVKQFLRPFWATHVVYEEFPVYGSKLKVDILNATIKVAIEVNGPQHDSFHYFHNGSPSAYLQGIKRDFVKLEWLEKNNFKLIEIRYDEVPLLTQAFFLERFGVTL